MAKRPLPRRRPKCVLVAGPNGAGKTTFAADFLEKEVGVVRFVNADLIASGLSPLRPGLAAIEAARLFLSEIDRLAKERLDFAFESTLSGRRHAARLMAWKQAGYEINIVFLKLDSPELALGRIAARVRQGGHDIPRNDVLRRFHRSWRNFVDLYQPLADTWSVYDNSSERPQLIEESS